MTDLEKERYLLWSDVSRPNQLTGFTYNLKTSQRMEKLAQSQGMPHLIISGIGGIGKKSIAMAFLRECVDSRGLHGELVYRTNNVEIPVKYNNKDITLIVQKSQYHFNINPSNYGIYDRYIVQDFLKKQTHYRTITKFPYHNVIVRDAENLTIDAQQSLRRTLEKCVKNCRFIFIVNTDHQGGLIPALKSRCIHLRMSAPSATEAIGVIRPILERQRPDMNRVMGDDFLKQFYGRCHGNVSRFMNLIQLWGVIEGGAGGMVGGGLGTIGKVCRSKGGLNLADICPITKCCQDIIVMMIESRTFRINEIRDKFYVLLAHGVNPEDIMKIMFKISVDNFPEAQNEIAELTVVVETNLNRSSREFYHLEDYTLKLLLIIKEIQNGRKKTAKKAVMEKKKEVKKEEAVVVEKKKEPVVVEEKKKEPTKLARPVVKFAPVQPPRKKIVRPVVPLGPQTTNRPKSKFVLNFK